MRMKYAFAASIVAAFAFVRATPAMACQLDDPVEIVRGALSARGKVEAVALARVTSVELTPVPSDWPKDFPPKWRALFEIESLLRGTVQLRSLAREQEGGPGSCDFTPPPDVGELRVLYIFDKGQVYDVGLEMARRFDATMRQVMPTSP